MLLPYPASDYLVIPGLSAMEVKEAQTITKTKSVEGSPYLYKNWYNEAEVYHNHKVYKFNSFNYNVYAERFEAKVSEDSIFIINPRYIDKIVIKDRPFKRYLDPEFQRNSYFEEIAKTDDFEIVRKYFTKIREADINPLTKVQEGSSKLIQHEMYYLIYRENQDLKRFKLKKSSVLKLIDKNYYNDIKSFKNRNRLKYNNIEDVAKIIQYYNTVSYKDI
tara:strand:- start:40549 stop:41205 length:657 start_codon:yes stop_codon:yes gene_type:complete